MSHAATAMGRRWSFSIGTVKGTSVRIHATFLLLLLWVGVAGWLAEGAAAALHTLALLLLVFLCVVLHEFGHIFAARRFGIRTPEVVLLPIGGVSRLERIPEEPHAEFIVAIAGPLVTLAIAGTLLVLLGGLPSPEELENGTDRHAILAQLAYINLALFVFNLLPAFPMDGGRVLRALLALRMDYLRATRIAARAGQIFALFFGIVGLMYDPVLVVIALFVWVAAVAESGAVEMHSSLAGVDVERVMIRDARTLAPEDPLSTALAHVLDGFQQDFPVVRGGAVVGVLTRSALLAGVAKHGVASPVELSMDRSFAAAEPGEPVERAVARLHAAHCQTMPVVSGGLLRGVLTLENVGEFVAIAAALRKAPPKVAAGAAVV